MADWHWVVLAFAALWGVQVVGSALQMRHVRVAMRTIGRRWSDGYAGCATARGGWGAGAVAVVVAGPDLLVREVLAMRGRTVFARLRPLPGLRGESLARLRAGDIGPQGGRCVAAIQAATEQVDRVRAEKNA